MKTLYQSLLLTIGALALAATAYAQVPTTNDTSDTNQNTGMGSFTLYSNTTGADNTASGFDALTDNTTGSANNASGAWALNQNTTGADNTASGFEALTNNTAGYYNTASGSQALYSNTTGFDETASGYKALYSNTTGSYNTAIGVSALYSNSTGGSDSAFGVNSLVSNTTGSNLSAVGVNSLVSNTTGNNNTASGYAALYKNTTGSNNIAVGYQAGYHITTGSNNIDIGALGTAADNGLIRIGTTSTHTAAYIAGITNSQVTGSAVYINSNGRLGVLASSERYKTAIAPMGSNSAKLQQLRPVTFHLKADPKGALQYGLIAEEVARVYPELVIRNESGRIDGVRYDELAPMLLNQMQKQAVEIRHLKQQQKTVDEMQRQLAEMHAVLVKLQPREELVVQR